MSVVAIMDAQGVLGREVVELIIESNPDWITELRLFGDTTDFVRFRNADVPVGPFSQEKFAGVDLAILGTAREVDAGAVCVTVVGRVDDDEAPVVLPEINPEAVDDHRGLVLVPDGAATALALLNHALDGVTRLGAVVLNPASRLGPRAIEELYAQTLAMYRHEPLPTDVLGDRLAYNLLPSDVRSDAGLSKLVADDLKVCVTDLLVPLFGGTMLVVDIQPTPSDLAERLERAIGLELSDEAQPADILGQSAIRVRLDAPGRVVCVVDEVRRAAWSLIETAHEIVKQDAF